MESPGIFQGAQRHHRKILQLIDAQLEEHAIDVNAKELSEAIGDILNDSSRGIFLLAGNSHHTIGVAYLSFIFSLEHPGKCAWLEELYVIPEFRGQGIGGLLIDAALRTARQYNCSAIDLEVEKNHARVENLYRRKGFSPLSRTRWHIVLGMDGEEDHSG
jgi:GNAT superfamily N-acetyltransferase